MKTRQNVSQLLTLLQPKPHPGLWGQTGHNRGELKSNTVTRQPIKGHFMKANSARDNGKDMHSGAYLHIPGKKKIKNPAN